MLEDKDIRVFTSPRDVRDSLGYYSRMGYGVDIKLYRPHWLDGAKISEMKRLGKELAARKIPVTTHGPFMSLDLGSSDSHIAAYSLERILFGLRLAEALGSKLFVVHTGFNPMTPKKSAVKWFERFCPNFERVLKEAKGKGIPVALENTWERDTALIKKVFREFGKDGLKFCLDFGHANCFSGAAAEEWLVTFRKYLVHLHIHDNRGGGDEHLQPGKGNIDWRKNIGLIRKYGLCPTATLEIERAKLAGALRHLRALAKLSLA